MSSNNPVNAGMVDYAWDYLWSSVHAHISGIDEFGLVVTKKMDDFVDDWKCYLLEAQKHTIDDFAKHERTGGL